MKIETKKLTDLIPSEYNPRKASKQQEKALSESLQKYGCVEPIIVNENPDRQNIIIGGHFRVRELIKLHIEEVECVIVNLNLEQERELNIRLNSNTGEWNFDLLLSNFNISDLESWGFNNEQLDKLEFKTEENKVDEMVDDSDTLPDIPKQPKTKLRDIFILSSNGNNHRLMCGDTTDSESVKRLMSSDNDKNYKQADLVITDPPYNVAYDKSKNFDKILNDEMSKEDFYDFLFKVFKNYNDIVLKDGGAIYVFHSDSERINFTKSFIDTDFYFSQTIIWVKNHFVMGRQDYQNKHEPILYGWKKGNGHYFIDTRTNSSVFEDEVDLTKLKKDELLKMLQDILQIDNTDTKNTNKPTTVIHCDKPNKSDLHPTMKPIKLIGKLIINSSKRKDLIVDLFGGSGSTLIASEQLDRQCYMMELDPHYCDVIIERWQNLTKQEAVRSDGVKYNDL
ncbi:MAG TPA: site-specific DNA-methyltransferase [Rickettsiales bacterium]|nr:site-specific DNA-methyltransferase [Rickettsiales bacterium]